MTTTATAETSTREALIAALAVMHGAENSRNVVDTMSDEEVAKVLPSMKKSVAERDALRARLVAEPVLSRAVCPARDWKTASDRYDVARRAVRLVETKAQTHGVTVAALAQALVDTKGTVADSIALHGVDPRLDAFAPGQSFYAFRWRLKDAVDELKKDEIRAEHEKREAAREAEWERKGLARCDRCGGAGGAKHWPGFTCFDCDGLGAMPRRR